MTLGDGFFPIAITAGATHMCAFASGPARIKCWGANTFGQLGYGDTLNRGNDPASMGNNLPAITRGGSGGPGHGSAETRLNC